MNNLFYSLKDYMTDSLLLRLSANTSGNTVSKWIDSSVYYAPATQSVVAFQPVLSDNIFGPDKGYVFDGSNDYMVIQDSDRFSFCNTTGDLPFTLKFKIKLIDNNTGWILEKRKEQTANAEWEIGMYAGTLYFVLFSEGRTDIYIGFTKPASIFSLNTIYSVKITYDASKSYSGLKFYINDSSSIQTTPYFSGTYVKMINTNSNVVIGKPNWFDGYNLKGALTDIEIYNNVI